MTDTDSIDVTGTARASFDGLARKPGVAKRDPVLVVEQLQRNFDGLVAVDVAHLEAQRHSITGLIGPNGAGKTTFFNLVSGFDRPQRGTVTLDGVALRSETGEGARMRSGLPPHVIARMGMVRTFQLTKVMSRMSVIDNMRLGATGQRGESIGRALLTPMWRKQEDEVTDRANSLLDRFGLSTMGGEYAGTLSGGQRKLLEMARALMTEPRVLLLDEPMAGVNPALKQSLLDHIAQLREEGRTIVFVEHDMDVVMGISDWVVCMAEGAVIAEGPPRHIASDPAVVDAYLGTRHARSADA